MRNGSLPCRFNSRASASRTLSIIAEFAGDMEAVEHVQSLTGALGGEPLEEAREDLDPALLADPQHPPPGVQLIHRGQVALADRPAISSTPSAVTPSRLIRMRPQSTAIPAARYTVSQEVSKMRSVSCHERRLANWPGTDRRPLSSAACRRPAGASRPRACRNAGRPRDAWRRPTESSGRAPARTGSGASQCGCSRVPGGRRRSKSISK